MPSRIIFTPNPEGMKQIRDAIYEGVNQTIDEATEHAKDLAFFGKYSTGETKESIANTVDETPHGVKARIFTHSGHGLWPEIGTKKMKAEPFLFPAFQRTIGKLFENIRRALNGGSQFTGD